MGKGISMRMEKEARENGSVEGRGERKDAWRKEIGMRCHTCAYVY